VVLLLLVLPVLVVLLPLGLTVPNLNLKNKPLTMGPDTQIDEIIRSTSRNWNLDRH